MNKKIYIFLFIVIVVLVSIFGVILGYTLFKSDNSTEYIVQTESETEKINDRQVDNTSVAKITPSTKMVYEYYYEADGITETVEDVPAYFLIDLTRSDLEKNFSNWQIKSFSETQVVMQKVIEGESNQHYIIKEYEGYIAVYYEKEINGTNIKEITNIPLAGLSEEEQAKIRQGIEIVGDEKLMRFLEGYGS